MTQVRTDVVVPKTVNLDLWYDKTDKREKWFVYNQVYWDKKLWLQDPVLSTPKRVESVILFVLPCGPSSYFQDGGEHSSLERWRRWRWRRIETEWRSSYQESVWCHQNHLAQCVWQGLKCLSFVVRHARWYRGYFSSSINGFVRLWGSLWASLDLLGS